MDTRELFVRDACAHGAVVERIGQVHTSVFTNGRGGGPLCAWTRGSCLCETLVRMDTCDRARLREARGDTCARETLSAHGLYFTLLLYFTWTAPQHMALAAAPRLAAYRTTPSAAHAHVRGLPREAR
jgi:hypothetical protein